MFSKRERERENNRKKGENFLSYAKTILSCTIQLLYENNLKLAILSTVEKKLANMFRCIFGYDVFTFAYFREPIFKSYPYLIDLYIPYIHLTLG